MLRIYRSNRAEWLASVLAEQLKLSPPDPFEQVEVIVNTWPSSRWLGEQLALVNGISAQIRFPFPGSHLRQLTRTVLGIDSNQEDPWRANRLVWPLLEILPEILESDEATPLRAWINRHPCPHDQLNREQWQLARSIADAFDDYCLYRPELLNQWLQGMHSSTQTLPTLQQKLRQNLLKKLPLTLQWQPKLFRLLAERLEVEPFCLQVQRAIEKLRLGEIVAGNLPKQLRLFGLSSLAPVQVELIQALSGLIEVEIFLLTPCPDLWQRCEQRRDQLGEAWISPPDGEWLLKAPRLEATLGRMGAEFQQLLEGTGESQFGLWQQGDLFAAPVAMAKEASREPTLLEQLQQQLVNPSESIEPPDNTKQTARQKQTAHQKPTTTLHRATDDNSVLFLSCPGRWREVQLIRDQILQWLAADSHLEPRDILIMTPQVDRFAPLLSSVFNDIAATGVELPWRLTDRSQQDNPGLSQALLLLLKIANERLTASALERLLSNPALQQLQGLSPEETTGINQCLQRTGFRWGLNAAERGGEETHSLDWCLDRWLLGLVLPSTPGLAPGGAAPFAEGPDPMVLSQWWKVLADLSRHIQLLRRPRSCQAWVDHLLGMIDELFGDGGAWNWERQTLTGVLEDWRDQSGECSIRLDPAVVVDVLNEALSVDSGRFGHRSGALTVSAMEPMRAIPHRVIVMMGLDANIFPRHQERPGFHLLEHQRQLGDPRSSDQDRYVLMEALMSSRQHLLITWNGRDEHTGESRPPASPVQQWLGQLEQAMAPEAFKEVLREPAANPLDRSNFLARGDHPPSSCDHRHLSARHWLDRAIEPPPLGLALPMRWDTGKETESEQLSSDLLLRWLINPQRIWLEQFDLKPREWFDALEDLEALELDERFRHQLLRDQFNKLLKQLASQPGASQSNSVTGHWLEEHAGTGTLPPGAAAVLASDQLERRWQHLQQTLLSIGPIHSSCVSIDDSSQTLLWADKSLVVVQPGRLSPRGVMTGWIRHLQVCASGDSIDASVVIARHSSTARPDQFEQALRWRALDSEEAEAQLSNLRSLAAQGLDQCWPVPPISGWVRVLQEQKSPGKGNQAFKTRWEGGFKRLGECTDPVLKLCFGDVLEAEQLLETDGFDEASTALYQPILQTLIP